jgi:hypothetical protein
MRRLRACLALCLPGLVALTACGTSTHSAARPAGPTTAAAASPAPAASAQAGAVHVGSQILAFDTPLPGNAAQARIIRDFRESEILWTRSDTAHHLVGPVTDYVTGDALSHLRAAVRAAKTDDLAPAGTDRLFLTRVTAVTAGQATISTCDDGSRATMKDLRTGQTMGFPSASQAYAFEAWHLVRLSGHWAVSSFSLVFPPDPRASQCQP